MSNAGRAADPKTTPPQRRRLQSVSTQQSTQRLVPEPGGGSHRCSSEAAPDTCSVTTGLGTASTRSGSSPTGTVDRFANALRTMFDLAENYPDPAERSWGTRRSRRELARRLPPGLCAAALRHWLTGIDAPDRRPAPLHRRTLALRPPCRVPTDRLPTPRRVRRLDRAGQHRIRRRQSTGGVREHIRTLDLTWPEP